MTCRPFGVIAGLAVASFALSACGGGGGSPAGMGKPDPNELIAECLDTALRDGGKRFAPSGVVYSIRNAENEDKTHINYQTISVDRDPEIVLTFNSHQCDYSTEDGMVFRSDIDNRDVIEPDGSPEVTDWNENHAEQWAKDNLDGLDPKTLPTKGPGGETLPPQNEG